MSVLVNRNGEWVYAICWKCGSDDLTPASPEWEAFLECRACGERFLAYPEILHDAEDA